MLPKIKQKISSTNKEIANLSIQIKIATIVGICILIFLVITSIGFFQVRTVSYLYAKNTCVAHISLLPDVFKNINDPTFQVTNSDLTVVGGITLFSGQTCFVPKANPDSGSYVIKTSLFSGWFSKSTYEIVVADPPIIHAKALLSSPIITNKTLELPISTPDRLYNYTLSVGEKNVNCNNSEVNINCDIDALNLEMGQEYNIKLVRLFNNKVIKTIIDQVITTRSRLTLSSASLTNGQIVYDNTRNIVLNFNKPIVNASISLIDLTTNNPVDSIVAVADKVITVSTQKDLNRNTNYKIEITSVVASDGSEITEPVDIEFKTSDGPTYLSSNINNYGTALNKTITLTFDQSLSKEQNILDYINVSGVNASVWKTDNQVYIKYNSAPACTNIAITIKPGIKSTYGFPQTKSWNVSTRTLCQSVAVIGVTARNRSIYAYSFGSGSQTILYTAALHGNEYSSKYLMEAWIDELEKNYNSIPSDKKIVVIPTINIDGNLADSRYNANGIDLNRNFPAFDWKTDIYTLSNQLLAGGGGSVPLSEPESQAIANYTQNISPKLVLSFHSAASCVIGNLAGNSSTLASNYSKLAGYRNTTGSSDTFSYPVTGSYDDWMRDELNIASVLVELATNSSSEFSRNKAALWAMANS